MVTVPQVRLVEVPDRLAQLFVRQQGLGVTHQAHQQVQAEEIPDNLTCPVETRQVRLRVLIADQYP